jgi:hypothetical protein
MFMVFRPVVGFLRWVSGRLFGSSGESQEPGGATGEPAPATAVAQTQRPSEPSRSAGADQKMQVLWCEPGEHEWERPSVPGRKPKTCPTHV